MFESENWKLSFYAPKCSILKKKTLMHTSLPQEASSYLNDAIRDFTSQNDSQESLVESLDTALKGNYVSFFSPLVVEENASSSAADSLKNPKTTSKLRFASKFTYKLPLQKQEITFSDSLIHLMLQLQNAAFRMVTKQTVEYNASLVENSMKSMFKTCMKAAGIFEWILKELVPSLDLNTLSGQSTTTPPFELTAEFNSILRNLFVAQAQEIGIYFSLDKEKKYTMLAKLAQKAFELYREAYEHLKTSPNFTEDSKKGADYFTLRGYLVTKMILFDAYSQIQNALYYNDNTENGKAMYLASREAVPRAKKAEKISKKFTSRYWDKESVNHCKEQINYICDLCERCVRRFEKENSTVYHDQMAEECPELLGTYQLGQVEEFTYPVPDNIEAFKDFYGEMHTGAEETALGSGGKPISAQPADAPPTGEVAGGSSDDDNEVVSRENGNHQKQNHDEPETSSEDGKDHGSSSKKKKGCTIL